MTGAIHPAQEPDVRAWLLARGLDAHTANRVLDEVPRLVSWRTRDPPTRYEHRAIVRRGLLHGPHVSTALPDGDHCPDRALRYRVDGRKCGMLLMFHGLANGGGFLNCQLGADCTRHFSSGAYLRSDGLACTRVIELAFDAALTVNEYLLAHGRIERMHVDAERKVALTLFADTFGELLVREMPLASAAKIINSLAGNSFYDTQHRLSRFVNAQTSTTAQ